MSVAIPSVPDRDNREPSRRQPRDWETDCLVEDMEKRSRTEDAIFYEMNERRKANVAKLRLIADAWERGREVEHRADAGSEWSHVGDYHSIHPDWEYRVVREPINGELADKIREFFRIAFAPPIGCAPVSANVKEILVGLGLAKGGEPCE